MGITQQWITRQHWWGTTFNRLHSQNCNIFLMAKWSFVLKRSETQNSFKWQREWLHSWKVQQIVHIVYLESIYYLFDVLLILLYSTCVLLNTVENSSICDRVWSVHLQTLINCDHANTKLSLFQLSMMTILKNLVILPHRSRTKNMMWYGVLGTKELLQRTYKNLEQKVQLEVWKELHLACCLKKNKKNKNASQVSRPVSFKEKEKAWSTVEAFLKQPAGWVRIWSRHSRTVATIYKWTTHEVRIWSTTKGVITHCPIQSVPLWASPEHSRLCLCKSES